MMSVQTQAVAPPARRQQPAAPPTSRAGGAADHRESVAVVGGGMMGIASALELAATGRFAVTLFERDAELGGLSSAYRWGDMQWDRFYHVVLSTDEVLIGFLRELGLDDELFWRETKTGFYGEQRLVSFSSVKDFVMFPFMSLYQKARLVIGILYSAAIKDPSRLDRVYVRQWLTRVFGRRLYERIWDPLLRSKLGEARERTSAAFIWATITRLYGAREAGDRREKMGHVTGGYARILSAARRRLDQLGVTVEVEAAVDALDKRDDGSVQLQVGDRLRSFDQALLTVPCPEIRRMCAPAIASSDTGGHPYWRRLDAVQYLGVTCVLLILKRSLSPYYVINLLDRALPFTGIVEATNVVPPDEVGDTHLVYLPKYAPADHPVNRYSNEEIRTEFVAALQQVFPDLRDDEILHTAVFRERWVQPLQQLDALRHALMHRTPLGNVFMANTAMIYNSTLNNNAVLTIAREAAAAVAATERVTTRERA